jgi:simple sugar transport system permease protein
VNAELRDLLLFNLLAVVLGIAASGALLLLLHKDPVAAYGLLASSIVRDRFTFADIFVKATPLILTALAFSLPFKASLFNIGAQGQFYLGALAASAVSLALGEHLPALPALVLVAMAAMAAGALGGAFIGWAKARFNSNEFLISMMSTYVALALMNWCLRTVLIEGKHEYPQTDTFASTLFLPKLVQGTRLHAGFILAVLAALGAWVLLYRTDLGYRIRAVGQNPVASRQAGIDAQRICVATFCMAGALAGLAGLTETNGVQHMLVQGFNPTLGAEGIGIAILANANPIGIVFGAILFGALKVGGTVMGQTSAVPSSIVEIMEGFVMVFVILAYPVRSMLATRRAKRALRRSLAV